MTTTRENAGTGTAAGAGSPVPPGERSLVRSIRGLRWWAALVLALVLTIAGVAGDLARVSQLGLLYMICFPVGCVLAVVWVRRSEMFGPMVQPPLLLAATVPVAVLLTGSLPRSGGLASTVIAVGGPLINGFPCLAITTAVCLALGFVRWRLERPVVDTAGRPSGARPGGGRPGDDRPRGGPGADGRERPSGGSRPRDDRPRDDRGRLRDDRARDDSARPARPGDDPGPGVYRVPNGEAGDRGRRPAPPR